MSRSLLGLLLCGGVVSFTVASSCVGGPPVPCTECSGVCVDTKTDPANCGGCGTTCSAGQLCKDSKCTASCPTGQTACTGGCADLKTSPQNCGACGTLCDPGQACEMGMCVASCRAGSIVCSGSCFDPMTDPNHCGDCATACPAGQSCSAGMCAANCRTGLTDCNRSCVDTQTDLSNCGACGAACAPANVTGGACLGGQCTYLACAPGWTDCDGDKRNGCEVETGSDLYNCGGCRAVCQPVNGVRPADCTFFGGGSLPTDAGAINADAGVVNLTDGGICNVVPLPSCLADAGTTTTLPDAGPCMTYPDAGPVDAGSTDAGACPADAGLADGGCIRPPVPTAGAACRASVCGVYQCKAGTGDCDGNSANGCETVLVGGLCPSNERSHVFPFDDFDVGYPRTGTFVIAAEAPATIYYTTDNSEPTIGGASTTSGASPLTVTNLGDANLRWWARFADGKREQTRMMRFRVSATPPDSWGMIDDNFRFTKNNSPLIIAAPGESLTANFTEQFWRSTPSGYCPGCVTPGISAVDGVGQQTCANTPGNTYPGNITNRSMTFTAPMTPGRYYVRFGFSYVFTCPAVGGGGPPMGLVIVK